MKLAIGSEERTHVSDIVDDTSLAQVYALEEKHLRT